MRSSVGPGSENFLQAARVDLFNQFNEFTRRANHLKVRQALSAKIF